ncbi:unnamed protein product [Aphanomyces euteiches]
MTQGFEGPIVALDTTHQLPEALNKLHQEHCLIFQDQRFLPIEVPADGNCLFHSIVQSPGGSSYNHASLRSAMCGFMRSSEGRDLCIQAGQLFSGSAFDLDKYSAYMEQDEVWAGEFEMQSIAAMLKMDIISFFWYKSPNGPRFNRYSALEDLQDHVGMKIEAKAAPAYIYFHGYKRPNEVVEFVCLNHYCALLVQDSVPRIEETGPVSMVGTHEQPRLEGLVCGTSEVSFKNAQQTKEQKKRMFKQQTVWNVKPVQVKRQRTGRQPPTKKQSKDHSKNIGIMVNYMKTLEAPACIIDLLTRATTEIKVMNDTTQAPCVSNVDSESSGIVQLTSFKKNKLELTWHHRAAIIAYYLIQCLAIVT